MTTITAQAQVEIDRPAPLVWAIVADYTRDPEWRQGVVRMTPTPAGLVQVGTTTAEAMRFAGRMLHNDGEVLTVDPGNRFTWRTTSGAEASGSRSVEALGDDRCRVHLELVVTPKGLEVLMAPVFRRIIRRTLTRDAADLVRLVESETEAIGA